MRDLLAVRSQNRQLVRQRGWFDLSFRACFDEELKLTEGEFALWLLAPSVRINHRLPTIGSKMIDWAMELGHRLSRRIRVRFRSLASRSSRSYCALRSLFYPSVEPLVKRIQAGCRKFSTYLLEQKARFFSSASEPGMAVSILHIWRYDTSLLDFVYERIEA